MFVSAKKPVQFAGQEDQLDRTKRRKQTLSRSSARFRACQHDNQSKRRPINEARLRPSLFTWEGHRAGRFDLVTFGEAIGLVLGSAGLAIAGAYVLHSYGLLQVQPAPAAPIAPVSVNADGSGRGLNFFLENHDQVDPLKAFLQ